MRPSKLSYKDRATSPRLRKREPATSDLRVIEYPEYGPRLAAMLREAEGNETNGQ